jgi:hypothetical protein
VAVPLRSEGANLDAGKMRCLNSAIHLDRFGGGDQECNEMNRKRRSGGAQRLRKPGETHASGQSPVKIKSRGKLFEPAPVGRRSKSMNSGLAKLFAEVPPTGERLRTNLARAIIEGRR